MAVAGSVQGEGESHEFRDWTITKGSQALLGSTYEAARSGKRHVYHNVNASHRSTVTCANVDDVNIMTPIFQGMKGWRI